MLDDTCHRLGPFSVLDDRESHRSRCSREQRNPLFSFATESLSSKWTASRRSEVDMLRHLLTLTVVVVQQKSGDDHILSMNDDDGVS